MNPFQAPMRQSYAAIIIITYKLYKVVIRQSWPFLIAFFVGRKRVDMDVYLYIVLTVSLLMTIYGVLAFFKFTFYTNERELIVEKGVFNRKKIIIPFERIQTINLHQKLLHQMLSVVSIEIDTAGSSKKEFEFSALTKSKGEALRDFILAHKKNLAPSIDLAVETEGEMVVDSPQSETVFRARILDLLKIGLTENHIRSLMLILFIFLGFQNTLKRAGLDVEKYVVDNGFKFDFGLRKIAVLMLIFLMIAVAYSFIRTFLKYFNLNFTKIKNGYKIEHGLLTRQAYTFYTDKIQMLHWQDNLLRKIPDIFNLVIHQAKSSDFVRFKNIIVPGISMATIDQVLKSTMPESDFEYSVKHLVSPKYFYRILFYIGCILILIGASIYYIMPWTNALILVAFLTYFGAKTYFFTQKAGFKVSKDLLYVQLGSFADNIYLIESYKLQSVTLSQSPFQRRNGLATVYLYTAAGKVKIPYLEYKKAEGLRDYCLYKVATIDSDWM